MNMIKKAWQRWLRVAEFLGNVQLTIFLTLMYWIMFPFWALPYRLFSDRLALRDQSRSRWIKRTPGADWLDSMRKQG